MLKRILGLFLVAFLFAATPTVFSDTVDLTGGSAAAPWGGISKTYVSSKVVDLTDIATGDVVQCLDIAANTFVFDVFVEVVTATGLVSTATVGDGDGANSWDASTNLNATAGTVTHGASGTDAYATSGRVYTSADTIDLTCTISGGPCTTGSVRVIAICATLQ